MWESKDQNLDINYNVAELWFPGVYGVPIPKSDPFDKADDDDPFEDFAEVEPLDSEAKTDETPRATRFTTPAPTASKTPADAQCRQRIMIDTWISDPQNPLEEKDRPMIELYAQLLKTSSSTSMNYRSVTVTTAHCHFVQWILSKDTKELVNSARASYPY
jgi:hypothetical protein